MLEADLVLEGLREAYLAPDYVTKQEVGLALVDLQVAVLAAV